MELIYLAGRAEYEGAGGTAGGLIIFIAIVLYLASGGDNDKKG